MERTRIYQSLLFIVILQQGAPTFESNPLKIVGMKTRQVTLYCESLLPNSPHGTHQCWYYKGSRIFCGGSPVPSRFDGRLSQGESCNLVISNLVEEDSGPYTYVSSSGYFGDVNLNVTNVPMVTSFLPYIEGVRGRSVILPCLNYPSEQPLLQRQNCWYHETTDIYCFSSPQSNTSRFTSRLIASNDNNLKISELQMSDAGRFTCFLGQSNYGKLKLTVKDGPITNISLLAIPKQLFVFEGQTLTLRCQVDSGSPPINWTWHRYTEDSKQPDSEFRHQQQQELKLTHTEQSSVYSCSASNNCLGQVTTLQSEKVKVFIVPRPVAHAISYWSLALSLCALIVLAVVLILRRKTTPPPSPPKKTALQPISTKAHPPPNTKQNVRGNAKTNVYQDSHQDNEKDFYCPLSSDTCTGEDVYDELV
ncbi:coxsackievirus and adenovirus receptor homolog isoform X5 [Polyodon spathula]|uniref:coxsackievirus and adenovirus receptor homolog isoform X5 n=1 Tax=Polyodon spathula TaxID=7913 RepID=UPI001B7F49AC|nr:coxsackievirus and adenovirus receptor homolog isoform X5 [Polyodon spathula]